MLKSRIDLSKPMDVLLYLRMSSDLQNVHSPDQQRDTIVATIQRLRKPWRVVGVYTDSGLSGKFVQKRPDLQRMLRDIRTGTVVVDAILVDTYERFGRTDELGTLRKKLLQNHGVVLLTADSNFSDPTSTAGHVMSAFEALRATEDNRVKAHNVLRGKRDAVKRGHWPGGPPPFGYRLRSIFVERAGRQEVDHSVLEQDPEQASIIRRIFALAAERGWGCTRIARALNTDAQVPSDHKPFLPQTVNRWLSHEIYLGILVWERVATDMIDDRRVRQRNDPSDFIRDEHFCERLVDQRIWEKVQELRQRRAQRNADNRAGRRQTGGKTIVATAPGIALKYPLSGLVRCGHCGRAMAASSTAIYATKTGDKRRYAAYICPGYSSGTCHNRRRIPEPWLRKEVLCLLARRLFGEPSKK